MSKSPARAILVILLSVAICRAESRHIEGIEYGQGHGHALTLDLYLPEQSETPRPTVVFVHGGGWKNGSRKSAKKTASWLSEHGFVVAAIDYRLTDVAGWPAQIDDCYEAVRWLRQNADRYNIDSDNIGAWGTSAGGHLAALMGTRSDPNQHSTSSRVRAVCDWFGPSDLLTMPPNNVGNGRTAQDVANSNGAKLLRATVRTVPDLARDASALYQVGSGDAAFLIMHGDQDPGVPLDQSIRLHASLIKAGLSSQLHVIEGAGHGGKHFQTATARQTVLRFFQRTLMPIWPQGSGPNADFTASHAEVPESWSVVRNEGVAWKKTLPETGQSTVTIWHDRLFFTTMQPVEQDSELGQNIVAWCCHAKTGETIWKRRILADHPLRLSGCFSDSSSPPPVTDGERVCFFNASGRITCFDFSGALLWSRDVMAVGRSQPFLVDNAIVFTRQQYMPDEHGHFTHEHKNAPLEKWTQLEAVQIATGETEWTSRCGVNMGCVPLLQTLADGRRVVFVGRGGGHSPPESPEGVSMIDAGNGSTIWTLPLPGFMSTMTFNLAGDHVLVFHDDEHLWVEVNTGKIARRINFLDNVPVRCREGESWITRQMTLPPPKKKRAIIQQSNVLAGKYHYFRSYSRPYLGRIHVDTGNVEYLQLPVQLKREHGSATDQLLWNPDQMATDLVERLKQAARKPPQTLPIQQWCFAPNDMKNSRGHVVMGDARSRGTGWGHHASQVPTVIGERLFVPIMNGTVYVLNARSADWDETAILAINDLGPVGRSFHRASLSFAGGRLYAHTIRQLICIDGQ